MNYLNPKTALELLQNYQPPILRFGCDTIDSLLSGGFRTGITEIAGEAGAGKTQFGLQLLMQAQLPIALGGLAGTALYICTEDAPTKRLEQMMDGFVRRHPDIVSVRSLMQNIFMEQIKTVDGLCDLLFHKVPNQIQSDNIRVIVLDSIAALYRVDYANDQFAERADSLLTIAGQLKFLSARNHMPVVIINQVTDYFEDNKSSHLKAWSVASSSRFVLPALGLTWANCINTRLLVSRQYAVASSHDAQRRDQFESWNSNSAAAAAAAASAAAKPVESQLVRKLHVIFAPHLPPIDADSIHGLTDEEPDQTVWSAPAPPASPERTFADDNTNTADAKQQSKKRPNRAASPAPNGASTPVHAPLTPRPNGSNGYGQKGLPLASPEHKFVTPISRSTTPTLAPSSALIGRPPPSLSPQPQSPAPASVNRPSPSTPALATPPPRSPAASSTAPGGNTFRWPASANAAQTPATVRPVAPSPAGASRFPPSPASSISTPRSLLSSSSSASPSPSPSPINRSVNGTATSLPLRTTTPPIARAVPTVSPPVPVLPNSTVPTRMAVTASDGLGPSAIASHCVATTVPGAFEPPLKRLKS